MCWASHTTCKVKTIDIRGTTAVTNTDIVDYTPQIKRDNERLKR